MTVTIYYDLEAAEEITATGQEHMRAMVEELERRGFLVAQAKTESPWQMQRMGQVVRPGLQSGAKTLPLLSVPIRKNDNAPWYRTFAKAHK